MHHGQLLFTITAIDEKFDNVKDMTADDAQKFLDNIRSWGVPELTSHADERQKDLQAQIENEKVKQENNYE